MSVLIGIAYHSVVILTVLVVLLRKREAAAAIGWSLAIVFVPVLGILLFLALGMTRIPRRLRRKLEHRESFRAAHERSRGGPAPSVARPVWESVAGVVERLGEAPPRPGNSVSLLEEGHAAFGEVFEAVAAATRHVHVESFIFRNDDLGASLLDLLCDRARDGVEVRVIVDAVGTPGAWTGLRNLRRAGGRGVVFMPLIPLGKWVVPNLRNHRKLIICDGRVGFFGGLNIGNEYAGLWSRNRRWNDLHVKVAGPCVDDLQRVFVEDWDFAADELLTPDPYPASEERPGDKVVQVIAGGPDQDVNAVRQTFFAAITGARRSVRIATPYLVPDAGLRDALRTAALRGVEVTILTQGRPPDHWLPFVVARYYSRELAAAGVRVFGYCGGMMHAKYMVVDDRWAAVGSANFDNRSLSLNFELIGTFESRSIVERVRERFLADIGESTELLADEKAGWRAWPMHAMEVGARLVAPLL